eukprot:248975-Prorocentrum_minimum.AAC.1
MNRKTTLTYLRNRTLLADSTREYLRGHVVCPFYGPGAGVHLEYEHAPCRDDGFAGGPFDRAGREAAAGAPLRPALPGRRHAPAGGARRPPRPVRCPPQPP